MIQAQELRIGNAVMDDTGRIGIVTELSKKSVRLKMEFSTLKIDTHHDEEGIDVEPIPLTPEILEKAGFYKEEGTIECWTKNDTEFSICKTLSGGFLFCQLSCDTVSIIGKSNIEYLHQLQNLYFALTQTELNYKL